MEELREKLYEGCEEEGEQELLEKLKELSDEELLDTLVTAIVNIFGTPKKDPVMEKMKQEVNEQLISMGCYEHLIK